MRICPDTDRWQLTNETLSCLLTALHSEEDLAAARYRRLHGRLVLFFMRHCAALPEDLADKVLNRVARKLAEGQRLENIEAFALGVARMVIQEDKARKLREQQCLFELERNGSNAEHTTSDCKDQLQGMQDQLAALPVSAQSALALYHEGRGIKRIQARKKLAQELGVSIGTLRKRIFDLQTQLRFKLKNDEHKTDLS
jgi:DNA-directed RNA polymerase specialized sigma24 family protein